MATRLAPRRWFRTVAALAMASCLALAGCGGDSDSEDGITTITFWDDNGGPARTPVWEHIIAEFERENPTIRVEYVGVPIAQAQQKYDTAIAGGGLPDVGGVSTAMLANLAARQALEPVDERIANSSLDGVLSEQVLESVRATVPDDKLYLVPLSTNMGVFWYRTDWFASAGIEPPTSWDEFFTSIERLTEAGQNRYGYTIRGGAGSIAQLLEVLYGQSGIEEVFDDDGDATVNDPRNVEALERITALYGKFTPEADVTNDYVKMVAQFDGGNIGIMQHNLGSYTDHAETLGADKVAAMTVPPAEDGNRTVTSHPVTGLGVFAEGDKKDAAFAFAEFAAGKEMNRYWSEQTGVLPANTDVGDLGELTHIAEATRVLNDPGTELVQLPYYLPEFNAITKTEAEPKFQQVLLGELSEKDFLDEMAGKLTDAQAAYTERTGS
ncbi:ABC transporter substrate-binding protein [Actinophytocola gossypii]|uniref:Sugar ABC transporter substrate-binding protein n=1 Tax=Actinophytocola gossypii TaxID=2812003 RepID=A0ABT2J2N6_9PSEU|nr:sugar ABC transporter substrate-binding protein [Actinophytocola gossypii]MCT2581559.1 sugar ABC transporter substrate-binding protein [Actinophytocola gossypii]